MVRISIIKKVWENESIVLSSFSNNASTIQNGVFSAYYVMLKCNFLICNNSQIQAKSRDVKLKFYILKSILKLSKVVRDVVSDNFTP